MLILVTLPDAHAGVISADRAGRKRRRRLRFGLLFHCESLRVRECVCVCCSYSYLYPTFVERAPARIMHVHDYSSIIFVWLHIIRACVLAGARARLCCVCRTTISASDCASDRWSTLSYPPLAANIYSKHTHTLRACVSTARSCVQYKLPQNKHTCSLNK